MATNRLLRTSTPSHFRSSSSSSFPFSLITSVRHRSNAKLNNGSNHLASGNGERKPAVAVKASLNSQHLITTKPTVRPRLLSGLAALAANVDHVMHVLLRAAVKRKLWSIKPQTLIETVLSFCFRLIIYINSGLKYYRRVT